MYRSGWTTLTQDRMEVSAPCGCIQAFFVTPQFEIYRAALVSRCSNKPSVFCEYNYVQLLSVALRLAACLKGVSVSESGLVPDPGPLAIQPHSISTTEGSFSGTEPEAHHRRTKGNCPREVIAMDRKRRNTFTGVSGSSSDDSGKLRHESYQQLDQMLAILDERQHKKLMGDPGRSERSRSDLHDSEERGGE